jgi:F1F0 ATPase subunit 2
MALGGFYFWALWRSVRKISEQRAHSLLLGYFFRLSLVLAGFFFIMGGHWERLVAALAGFLVMRSILVRRWGDRRPGII